MLKKRGGFRTWHWIGEELGDNLGGILGRKCDHSVLSEKYFNIKYSYIIYSFLLLPLTSSISILPSEIYGFLVINYCYHIFAYTDTHINILI